MQKNFIKKYFLFIFFKFSFCSHFRFGVITWKPLIDNGATVTVEFTSIYGWRRGAVFCDDTTISSGKLIGYTDKILCDIGCATLNEPIGNLIFQCTQYSIGDDWTMGERTFAYTVPKSSNVEAAYTGSAWVTLNSGGGSWEVRVRLDTTVRSDTGKINTSPVTSMPPTVCIRNDVNYTITIPTADADNDNVRCRWSNKSLDECGGVCGTVPPAILDTNACKIYFVGALSKPGPYAAAIMLEDFKNANDTIPMSGVPLQFLINVTAASGSCNTPPSILGDRSVGSCIAVPLGTVLKERILAQVGCASEVLKDIQIIGPTGIGQGSLTKVAGTNDQYERYLTWTPIASQIGPNVICAKAIDTTCLSSDNHCFTVLAGIDPPSILNGSCTPSGFLNNTILAGNNGVITWSVEFNKVVLRPVKPSYIRFYRSNGTLLFQMDASVFPTVTYNGSILSFQTGNNFEDGSYYILFDYGAGLGSEYCEPESDAVKDPNFCPFTISRTTTTTIVTATAPTTIPGQTLGLSALSSTASPILPVGWTTNGTGTTTSTTTTTATTTTTTITTSTTNLMTNSTTSSSTTITSTTASLTTTKTSIITSTKINTCTETECNVASLALLSTIFLSSAIGAHVSSMSGVFLYLMKKKKAEEANPLQ